jgi:hypothetical protein
LLDMVRSMMSQADLPLSFWGYALETAAFTMYRIPSKSVEKTPYEIWTGKCMLTVKIRQPSHEFTFGVGMSFIPYPLVLTPVV